MEAAKIHLGHLAADDKLRRVLEGALKARGVPTGEQAPIHPGPPAFWAPEYFGLERCAIFRDASEEEQQEILARCGRGLVEEAYFIEKTGVGFAAKMVLQAESTEERALYGLITAEEATHLMQVMRYLGGEPPAGSDDPFLALLTEAVDSDEKPLLLFVIQVMLEGWGLSHYRSMARGCGEQELRGIFEAIVVDEARHHGSGVVLFDRTSMSSSCRDQIVGVMDRFLGMVRVGPQRVLSAVERVKGHLSREQKVHMLEELDTLTHSGARLETLKGLMKSEAAAPILGELEERGAFEPLPAERCAA